MADNLGIKRCWFHKDHYDIPKRRIDEVMSKCEVVRSKDIVNIIKGTLWQQSNGRSDMSPIVATSKELT